ncbi:uncharacterized protein A4U43_C08F32580 [Asparagus officinalis]|uniref:uncharacterized protein LOC109851429 isoform X2 n=1 Tax=Asparagus officinalis TaxID=4686 RepID=UPI00098E2000|nr:uncharacterized protein LOC109851429 isoform X2 [Asparagus officinalis]ONK61692.1 uncharacterized protein A4U43_C08F32580 [Asparagus officinalis]
MAREPSPEIDDELFNEVYGKEYTGPPRPTGNNGSGTMNMANKRPHDDHSADDEEPPDPNAVPTDFTSREARVWEAKAKATERNWKKRKEEEMICKICGESGHFTQGCPSTLGANRKAADFFERVPARDKNVRALFSDKVISQIEKDVGCKIKMDEKFLFVSGKDRLILSKGVDAVHKLIQDDKNKSSTSSHGARSKSPVRSPADSHYRRSESQKSNPSPRSMSRFQNRPFNQERIIENRVRDDLQKLSRDSPRAYASDGPRGQSTHSRSPPRTSFRPDSFSSIDGHSHNTAVQKTDSWNVERGRTDFHSEKGFSFPPNPQTLEELEMEFKREAMDIGRLRDQEEDEENYKHREYVRELRENYMKKLAVMRGMHLKQWEEFLQFDIQRRQQSRFNAYNQPAYPEFNQSSRDPQYGGANLPMDSRNRHPFPSEDYQASRPHDLYGGDFQRQRRDDFGNQRHDDFGRAYGRY